MKVRASVKRGVRKAIRRNGVLLSVPTRDINKGKVRGYSMARIVGVDLPNSKRIEKG